MHAMEISHNAYSNMFDIIIEVKDENPSAPASFVLWNLRLCRYNREKIAVSNSVIPIKKPSQ